MMKKTFLLLFLLFTTITFAQKDEELVKKSFDGYKSSILNDEGANAVNFLSSKTLDYYGLMLKKAQEVDSISLNSMNLLDKIFVMRLRYGVDKEKLLSFTPRSLLKYAIDEGMVGKDAVIGVEIGEVLIDKNFARAQPIANNQKAPFYFHFYKEDGNWKMDLSALMSTASGALKQMVEKSGRSENEFILEILKYLEPEGPKNNVWKSIKPS